MTALMLMALAVSIGLGYKTKINIGFFTIAFAYLIGCFGMGLKPPKLLNYGLSKFSLLFYPLLCFITLLWQMVL